MLNWFRIIATCAPSPKGEKKELNHNVKKGDFNGYKKLNINGIFWMSFFIIKFEFDQKIHVRPSIFIPLSHGILF